MTASIVVAWIFVLRPLTLGGPASFVGVEGISMTPTMHNGDLAVIERRSSYHVGDVVAYRIPKGSFGYGHNIIHRIVGGNGRQGFVTKGDHNGYTDVWTPTSHDILGKVWIHLPGGANWLARLREPLPLAIIVGFLTFLLVAWPTDRGRLRRTSTRSSIDEVPQDPIGTSAESCANVRSSPGRPPVSRKVRWGAVACAAALTTVVATATAVGGRRRP